MPTTPEKKKFSRRSFLKKTGWVAAGLTLTAGVAYPFVKPNIPAIPTVGSPDIDDGLLWLQVLPTGKIRFYCPRMEMGQGAVLGLSQVVAEELNLDQQQIECVLPATNKVSSFQMTVGSESIRNFIDPVSLAAARLREVLRTMAAQNSGIELELVKDSKAGFILPDGKSLAYGDLVPSSAFVISEDDELMPREKVTRYTLQRRGKFQAIGEQWKSAELESIVTGKTVFSRDKVIPDMMYGQIIHPPAFGARVKSVDDSVVRTMADISIVVVDKGNDFTGIVSFVGVVADSPFILQEAVDSLKIQWQMPDGVSQTQLETQLDVEALRASNNFEHTVLEEGDIGVGASAAEHQISARYDTPFAAHAAMEPRAAVAWVQSEKVEVWCGTQDSFYVQKRVALLLERPAEEVVVYPLRMGGGFGGRIQCKASEEAAILSEAVKRPVRVQWSREAEFQNNYFQPMFSHFIDAGVNNKGEISHWDHDFVSSPIIMGQVPANLGWVTDKIMADFGTSRGSKPPYNLPNQRTRFTDIRTPVPVGAWRALGAAPNTFAIESMMDELAIEAKIDPLEFRLNNLRDDQNRLAGVLRKVADISNWQEKQGSMAKDTGLGIACASYKQETPVAVVAQVVIDHDAGKIQVVKMWCAQDCGLIINPDQVENLILGNLVWGCSMALKEKLTIANGSVEQENFHSYEILRNDEAPDMIVSTIEPSGASPVGVGESAMPPVAAAIANALYAATGKRARKLPINYDAVFTDS